MPGQSMNQQIRELAIKANLYVDVNGQPWPRNMNGEDIEGAYQKFAELIVRECAKFLDENSGADQCNNVWCPAPEDLLKHFGVEE